MTLRGRFAFFFFFNDTATTEIYTLSLHDALPIWHACACPGCLHPGLLGLFLFWGDRKSTRLNSSHLVISYAVFCLKKKNKAGAGVSYNPSWSARPRRPARLNPAHSPRPHTTYLSH